MKHFIRRIFARRRNQIEITTIQGGSLVINRDGSGEWPALNRNQTA